MLFLGSIINVGVLWTSVFTRPLILAFCQMRGFLSNFFKNDNLPYRKLLYRMRYTKKQTGYCQKLLRFYELTVRRKPRKTAILGSASHAV